MWDDVTPAPIKRELQIKGNHTILRISPAQNDQEELWQWFDLSFGKHSRRSYEECQQHWPREALARAREILDEFERQLDLEETDAQLDK